MDPPWSFGAWKLGWHEIMDGAKAALAWAWVAKWRNTTDIFGTDTWRRLVWLTWVFAWLLCVCGIIQLIVVDEVYRIYVEDMKHKREFLSKRKSIVTVVKLHLAYCKIPGKLFSRESSSNPEFGHNPYAAGSARRLLSKWSTRNSNPRRNLTLKMGGFHFSPIDMQLCPKQKVVAPTNS